MAAWIFGVPAVIDAGVEEDGRLIWSPGNLAAKVIFQLPCEPAKEPEASLNCLAFRCR